MDQLNFSNISSRENENMPYYFIFTRHAYSCNNATDNSGWLKKQKNLIKKVLDPHLTDYGILNTIKIGQKNRDKYNSSTVFVSCLIRTWETTVLLYLPNIGLNDTLNIIISPFLKEKHGVLKIGNYPNIINNNGTEELDIQKSMDHFIVFLNLLEKKYITHFNKQKLSKIIIHYNGMKYLMSDVFKSTSEGNIFRMNTIRGGTYNIQNQPNEEIIIPNINNNELNITTNCEMGTEYLYPNINLKFYVNNSKENLLLFILWVVKNLNNGIFQSHNHEIHVVAHSNIMQSFMNIMKNIINLPSNIEHPILNCEKLVNYKEYSTNMNDLKIITNEQTYKNIIKTNSWSIESLVKFTENNLKIVISKLTSGVPKLKNTDPVEHELCNNELNNVIVPKNNLIPNNSYTLNFGGKYKKQISKRSKRKKGLYKNRKHKKTKKLKR